MAQISSIPIELRVAILRELTDIQDLLSAILSLRSLYEAFREGQTVAGHVLQKQIDTRLLPHALAILDLESAHKNFKDAKDISHFLDKCRSTSPLQASEQLSRVTLAEALHVMELHHVIQYFAADFATRALALLLEEGIFQTSPPSLSSNEVYRIERSFYCFELYRCLFGVPPIKSRLAFSAEEQRDLFFERHAPWEKEQLACVHDYLLEQLSPVAAHDIVWGELPIDWLEDGCENLWKQRLLFCGVKYLHQVSNASTYEERRRILHAKVFSPPSNSDPLAQGLLESNEEGPYPDNEPVCRETVIQEYYRSSWYVDVDGDTGPAEIWFQANLLGRSWPEPILSVNHDAYRKTAYVMLDLVRKDDLAHFDGVKKSGEWQGLLSSEERDRRFGQMRSSFKEREKIWQAGGRGWWSEGDTSHIEWTRGRPINSDS